MFRLAPAAARIFLFGVMQVGGGRCQSKLHVEQYRSDSMVACQSSLRWGMPNGGGIIDYRLDSTDLTIPSAKELQKQ